MSPWWPKTTTVRFLDQAFELHPSWMGLSEEMALFGTHEPVATRVYLEHLREGNHVLDVGSNLGYYVLLAAHAVGARGQVLGFEPASDVYAILKRNIARSNFSHIQVFPWAIGERDGSVQFYESEVPNWGSVVQSDRILQNRTVTVPIKRLDDLLKQFPGFRPDVLRMDVEGGELPILEGAQRTLEKYRPNLFIEFHADLLGWRPVREAILKLRDLGYSSGTLIERNWDDLRVARWVRERRRCHSGSMNLLLGKIESHGGDLTRSCFTLILKARNVSK